MKAVFARQAGHSYAYKVEGVPADYHLSFGRQVSYREKIKAFEEKAKIVHIDTKGKATLSQVRKWVKENEPLQFFAKWQSDSSSYRDDVVILHYLPRVTQ